MIVALARKETASHDARTAAHVIRGSGTSHAISRWLCSFFVGGFLLLAAVNVQRWDGATDDYAGGALFAAMQLYTETLRVELDGDEISYWHFFKRRRSLRLDQIRSVRSLARSTGREGRGIICLFHQSIARYRA
jgi:hypothetical protein